MKTPDSTSVFTKAKILDQILVSVDHALMVFDKDWRLQCWSRPTAKILGYPEELLQAGRPIRDYVAVYAESGILAPGDPQQLIRKKLEEFRNNHVYEEQVRLPSGGF
jgi:histidine kinase